MDNTIKIWIREFNFGKHCFGLDINFGAKLIKWFSVTLEYAPGMLQPHFGQV
jgi:hypothetical protein